MLKMLKVSSRARMRIRARESMVSPYSHVKVLTFYIL